MSRLCLYCGSVKEDSDFSEEHIIPKCLGGNLTPDNPFKIDNVCKRCNNIAGFFIDDPFIKNYLMNSSYSRYWQRYIDFETFSPVPLHYMGHTDFFPFNEHVCDVWIGPAGDQIYHFHEPFADDPDIPCMVGIPTYLKGKGADCGFAFIFLRASNPQWCIVSLRSFVEHFRGIPLYLGNGPKPNGPAFSEIPEHLVALRDNLHSYASRTTEMRVSTTISTDFHERFLAKISLGLGYVYLGDLFLSSLSAANLRKYMWTKNANEREEMRLIRGSSFYTVQEQNIVAKHVWSYGHALSMLSLGGSLILIASFFGAPPAVIEISRENSLIAEFRRKFPPRIYAPFAGTTFLISPVLHKYLGPLDLLSFFQHKMTERKEEAIRQLEDSVDAMKNKKMPPYHILTDNMKKILSINAFLAMMLFGGLLFLGVWWGLSLALIFITFIGATTLEFAIMGTMRQFVAVIRGK